MFAAFLEICWKGLRNSAFVHAPNNKIIKELPLTRELISSKIITIITEDSQYFQNGYQDFQRFKTSVTLF